MAASIYRLTSNNTTGAYQIPSKGVLVEKRKGQGLKEICYVPGSDSIWVEDQKGEWQRQKQRIWIENGFIAVSDKNKRLNEFLQIHPRFDIDFYLVDEEQDIKNELEEFELKDKAITLFSQFDTEELQAIGTIVIGINALTWNEHKTKAVLRKELEKAPKAFIDAIEGQDFEIAKIAGNGFLKGIVKHDTLRNAVVWNDKEEAVILNLATGQNPLKHFRDILLRRDAEAKRILDLMVDKIDKINKK